MSERSVALERMDDLTIGGNELAEALRQLRVINQDIVAPGQGFPTHPHADMEIITVVLRGTIEHKDSMGNKELVKAGEIQRMSAGTGVRHSEFNPSTDEAVHLLQIWILPESRGTKPTYDQKRFDDATKRNRLTSLASGGADGALRIGQDATMYASLLESGREVSHDLAPGRGAWVQVVAGDLDVNGTRLTAGDGAAIEDESTVRLTAKSDSEFLLFDLA